MGQWEGTLRQQGVKPFAIGVRIVSATEPSRNVVNYGGEIDCSGTWRYLDAEGPQVRFRERIDRGAGGEVQGHRRRHRAPARRRLDGSRYEFRGGGIDQPRHAQHAADARRRARASR